jgi:low affinity Fe/Cu permease
MDKKQTAKNVDWFRQLAHRTADSVGNPRAFTLAALTIIIWLAAGPLFQFSDTWQLIINTATTIVTFLMVFLIQNSQNRDSKAVHLKLDELIRAVKGARTELVNLENLTDAELERLQKEFKELHEKLAHNLSKPFPQNDEPQ